MILSNTLKRWLEPNMPCASGAQVYSNGINEWFFGIDLSSISFLWVIHFKRVKKNLGKVDV